MKKQPLLNTYVNNISIREAVDEIEKLILGHKRSYVVPVNVDVIVKIENDSRLKKIVDNADLVLADGKPLIWISRSFKTPIKEKVSGSDLVPLLCEMSAKKKYSIFLIGGKDGVAEAAKNNLERAYAGIRIVGVYSPPIGFEKDAEECKRINDMISSAHPDILIVCLGCPKQEKWVYDNYKKYDAVVSICAGASVDFLAGSVRRAPKWMSDHGLEWFYRFMQEPKRLYKRYFVEDMKIIRLVKKYRTKKQSRL